jgi:serine/threonine protein kinase/Tfp pilus assembly protein PilF
VNASAGLGSRSGSIDAVLAEIVEEVTNKLRAGEPVDIETYAGAHPELAERLRRLLPALAVLADLGRSAAAGEAVVVSPDAAPTAELTELGDFRIVGEIGRGGMGVVYEAVQVSLGRRVALKVLPFAAALDPRQLQRFKTEAQAAALLHHTNIVPVHAVGCERGVHYYAMQRIDGQNLAAVIRELRRQAGHAADGEPSPPPAPARLSAETLALAGLSTDRSRWSPAYFRAVAQLGVQAAEALEHAHDEGVVHRDIKPANLLLDAKEKLWITDFGLAHCRAGAELTMTGDVVGTLRYMSPEQALGKRLLVDHRTDIYSLGVTLYEFLTLEPAFPGSDREEVLRQIASEEPRPPRRINQAIPPELETIIQKAIEKNPADRYATAQELADDLERFLKHEPIRARRPTVVHRLVKWSRRHADWVAGAVVVLLFGVVGTGVSAWLIVGQRDVAREAAKTAHEAEEKSRQEAAIATAVNGFLQHLLSQAAIWNQPSGRERNRDIAVREVLDRAAKEIDGKFAGQELTEAAIRWTLGDAYHAMGALPEAEKHLKRCLALRQEKLSAEHHDTLQTINKLAMFYLDCGRYEEAEPLFKQALEGQRAEPGPDQTLGTMNNLASLYGRLGRYDEAEQLLRQVLERMLAECGADDPNTLRCMANLAVNVYLPRGRYQEAEALLNQALQGMRTKLGADHPDTLTAMGNLASLYFQRAEYDEAEPLLKDALEVHRAKQGAGHPSTLRSMNNLAVLYQNRGRYEDAEPLLLEVVDGWTAQLGPDNPESLTSMNNLASLYQACGRYNEAEPYYCKALNGRRAKLGPYHALTLNTMNNLGTLYWDLGRYDQAEALLQQALEGGRANLGHDHTETLTSIYHLGGFYKDCGRYADAERLLTQALGGRRTKLGADHPDTIATMRNLASLYEELHRYEEAESLFKEAVDAMRVKLGPEHPRTLTSMGSLASLYLDLARYEQAEALFKQGLKGMRAKLGPAHPDSLATMTNLAKLYEARCRYDEAEPLLRECLAMCEKKRPDDWQRFRAQCLLGGSLLGQKKYAEAEALLLEGYEGMKQREQKVSAQRRERDIPAAVEHLVKLYDAWAKPEKAARWRKELEARQAKGKR